MNSTVWEGKSPPNTPPSLIRSDPPGDRRFTSVSSSVNSTSPSYRTSTRSPLFDQLKLPCDCARPIGAPVPGASAAVDSASDCALSAVVVAASSRRPPGLYRPALRRA